MTERPFWLEDEDCPFWCTGNHYSGDDPDERYHIDLGSTVHLRLHPGWGPLFEAQPVHVHLMQGYRETQPRVEVWHPPSDTTYRLDMCEAETLARLLTDAIRSGQKSHNASRPGGSG